MNHTLLGEINASGPAATVTATPEEVRLARELWRRLEQRYFGDGDNARRPVAAWCVGAD